MGDRPGGEGYARDLARRAGAYEAIARQRRAIRRRSIFVAVVVGASLLWAAAYWMGGWVMVWAGWVGRG